jgi:ligand-binding sensor domain-containing protein
MKNNIISLITAFLLLWNPLISNAQCPGAAGESFPDWEYATSVGTIAMIDDGNYYWIGGYYGLKKLGRSGTVFRSFNLKNSPVSIISHMKQDLSGNLWMTSYHGTNVGKLIKYDKFDTWEIFTPPTSWHNDYYFLSDIEINKSTGFVYFSFSSDVKNGIGFFDGCNWVFIDNPTDNYRDFTLDYYGNIWLSDGNFGSSLYKYENESWTEYSQGINFASILNLNADNSGNVWFIGHDYYDVDSTTSYLCRVDGTNFESWKLSDLIKNQKQGYYGSFYLPEPNKIHFVSL